MTTRPFGFCCAGLSRATPRRERLTRLLTQLLEKARRIVPDLVILDCAMPVMTGLQAACEIAKTFPALPMLLVSVQQLSPALAQAAREAGLKGAVTKDRRSEVVAAVGALLRN